MASTRALGDRTGEGDGHYAVCVMCERQLQQRKKTAVTTAATPAVKAAAALKAPADAQLGGG